MGGADHTIAEHQFQARQATAVKRVEKLEAENAKLREETAKLRAALRKKTKEERP